MEVVTVLGSADVGGRKFLAMAPFAAVAGVGPSRDWVLSTLEQSPAPGPHVRLEDVTAVRNIFGAFQQMDIFQGAAPAGRRLPST